MGSAQETRLARPSSWASSARHESMLSAQGVAVASLARRLARSYSGGVAEPAYEVSIQELAASPHLLDKALRSVALGRTVRLVTGAQEPVADIIPDSLLQELEETIEVLADSEAVQALIEAREAVARGDVVRGVDAVRALLDERQ